MGATKNAKKNKKSASSAKQFNLDVGQRLGRIVDKNGIELNKKTKGAQSKFEVLRYKGTDSEKEWANAINTRKEFPSSTWYNAAPVAVDGSVVKHLKLLVREKEFITDIYGSGKICNVPVYMNKTFSLASYKLPMIKLYNADKIRKRGVNDLLYQSLNATTVDGYSYVYNDPDGPWDPANLRKIDKYKNGYDTRRVRTPYEKEIGLRISPTHEDIQDIIEMVYNGDSLDQIQKSIRSSNNLSIDIEDINTLKEGHSYTGYWNVVEFLYKNNIKYKDWRDIIMNKTTNITKEPYAAQKHYLDITFDMMDDYYIAKIPLANIATKYKIDTERIKDTITLTGNKNKRDHVFYKMLIWWSVYRQDRTSILFGKKDLSFLKTVLPEWYRAYTTFLNGSKKISITREGDEWRVVNEEAVEEVVNDKELPMLKKEDIKESSVFKDILDKYTEDRKNLSKTRDLKKEAEPLEIAIIDIVNKAIDLLYERVKLMEATLIKVLDANHSICVEDQVTLELLSEDIKSVKESLTEIASKPVPEAKTEIREDDLDITSTENGILIKLKK